MLGYRLIAFWLVLILLLVTLPNTLGRAERVEHQPPSKVDSQDYIMSVDFGKEVWYYKIDWKTQVVTKEVVR